MTTAGTEGWVITEAAHVPGTDVVTCRVAPGPSPLRHGDIVTASPRGVGFVVEEILHHCFVFEVLETQTEGQVVLRGSDAGEVSGGQVLRLGAP